MAKCSSVRIAPVDIRKMCSNAQMPVARTATNVWSFMAKGMGKHSDVVAGTVKNYQPLINADKRKRNITTSECLPIPLRSEEHTSELQSRGHLVCRLLLEKKKCRRPR